MIDKKESINNSLKKAMIYISKEIQNYYIHLSFLFNYNIKY